MDRTNEFLRLAPPGSGGAVSEWDALSYRIFEYVFNMSSEVSCLFLGQSALMQWVQIWLVLNPSFTPVRKISSEDWINTTQNLFTLNNFVSEQIASLESEWRAATGQRRGNRDSKLVTDFRGQINATMTEFLSDVKTSIALAARNHVVNEVKRLFSGFDETAAPKHIKHEALLAALEKEVASSEWRADVVTHGSVEKGVLSSRARENAMARRTETPAVVIEPDVQEEERAFQQQLMEVKAAGLLDATQEFEAIESTVLEMFQINSQCCQVLMQQAPLPQQLATRAQDAADFLKEGTKQYLKAKQSTAKKTITLILWLLAIILGLRLFCRISFVATLLRLR